MATNYCPNTMEKSYNIFSHLSKNLENYVKAKIKTEKKLPRNNALNIIIFLMHSKKVKKKQPNFPFYQILSIK